MTTIQAPFLGLRHVPEDQHGLFKGKKDLRVRFIVYLSGCQNHRCAYCTLPIHVKIQDCRGVHGSDINVPLDYATIEHVELHSVRQNNDLTNLVAACSKCNELRGSYSDAIEFAEAITVLLQNPAVRNRWHSMRIV